MKKINLKEFQPEKFEESEEKEKFEESEDLKKAKKFFQVSKGVIYLLIFLLPVFFLPFSFEVFEFNKQYVLFFLVFLAFFAWLAKMILIDKEIRFKRSPLDIFVLAFLLVAVLSAIFSVNKTSSLFGFYGRFSDGLLGLLSFVALYFLITNNVRLNEEAGATKPISLSGKEPREETSNNAFKRKGLCGFLTLNGLLKVFLWSVFFVVLFGYFSVFGVWEKSAVLR